MTRLSHCFGRVSRCTASSAVHDALGVWIDEIPVTPEKILEALRRKEKGEAPRYGPQRFPPIPYPPVIKVDAPPPAP